MKIDYLNTAGEPAAPEPVNTMDLGDTFNQLIVKKEEEEQQVEVIEQADIRLMLFPSQIHKIGCLISLLTYHRDLLQRYSIIQCSGESALPNSLLSVIGKHARLFTRYYLVTTNQLSVLLTKS